MRWRPGIALLVCACARYSSDEGPEAAAVRSYYAAVAEIEARYQICFADVAPQFASQYVAQCFYGLGDFTIFGLTPGPATQAISEIKAGHTRFEADRAARCLAALQTPDPATCWGPGQPVVGSQTPTPDPAFMLLSPPGLTSANRQRMPDDCAAVFTGLVPDGAACDDWRDCASHVCDLGATFTEVCHPAASEGARCAGRFAQLCPIGLFCAAESTTCSRIRQAGQPCTSTVECELGLSCLNGSCALADVGQPCQGASNCKTGLVCSFSSGPGICQAPPATTYNCAANPPRFQPVCVGQQICSGPTGQGTCGVPQDVGGSCIPGLQGKASGCYAGLACDSSAARCVLPPKTGEPCPDGQCDPFSAFCSAGLCKAQVDDGQPARRAPTRAIRAGPAGPWLEC